jgi:hypothetical protein
VVLLAGLLLRILFLRFGGHLVASRGGLSNFAGLLLVLGGPLFGRRVPGDLDIPGLLGCGRANGRLLQKMVFGQLLHDEVFLLTLLLMLLRLNILCRLCEIGLASRR